MAAPAFINGLDPAGSLSADAALVVFQDGDTFRTTPRALITEAASFTPSGSGAVAGDVQGKLRIIQIDAWDFMSANQRSSVLANDQGLDMAAAINAAAVYAATVINPNSLYTDQIKAGAEIVLPSATLITTSASVVLPTGVSLAGHGKTSSIIKSSFNGPIIRNSIDSGYNWFGARLRDFGVYGDLTKASQYGIDLLRPLSAQIDNIYIQGCGKDGMRLAQAITCTLRGVDSNYNKVNGINIEGGRNTWADATANSLPSNNNTLIGCHGNANDGPGLLFGTYANGNVVYGGAFENNYAASGDNIGFNVEFRTSGSFHPNELVDVWVEGPVQAHVYQSSGSISVVNRLTRLRHAPDGAAGNVDHAVLNDVGTLIIDSPMGLNAAYKTVSGTGAPFRVGKPNAVIYLNDPIGCGLSRSSTWAADTSGNVTGLENYLYQRSHGYTRDHSQSIVMDSGAASFWDVYRSGEANSFVRVNDQKTGFDLGPGTGAVDTNVYRSAADVLGTDDSFLLVTADRAYGQKLSSVTSSAAAVTFKRGFNSISMAENVTGITMPASPNSGDECTIVFYTGAGGFTVAGWPASIKLAGSAFTLTATAGKIDTLTFKWHDAFGYWVETSRTQNVTG